MEVPVKRTALVGASCQCFTAKDKKKDTMMGEWLKMTEWFPLLIYFLIIFFISFQVEFKSRVVGWAGIQKEPWSSPSHTVCLWLYLSLHLPLQVDCRCSPWTELCAEESMNFKWSAEDWIVFWECHRRWLKCLANDKMLIGLRITPIPACP